MMKQKSDNLDIKVRQIYEPRYGRKLSEKEVLEISHNLKSYAEVILRIASQITYVKPTEK